MADDEQTMCRICQYHQKTKGMPPGAPADRRPCWQLAQRPHAYPPDTRRPSVTIAITCSHFSHINGGSLTYRNKKR